MGRRCTIALAVLAIVAVSSGCGSSSKSTTSTSAAAHVKFLEWVLFLKPSNNGPQRKVGLRDGSRIQFIRDCTATIPRLIAIFNARDLMGKLLNFRVSYVSPQGRSKLLFSNTNSKIRNGQSGLHLKAPTSRGFTGEGRFRAAFLLSGKLLATGSFRVQTGPKCRSKRNAAGLLATPG
jgi:hypothetical protein